MNVAVSMQSPTFKVHVHRLPMIDCFKSLGAYDHFRSVVLGLISGGATFALNQKLPQRRLFFYVGTVLGFTMTTFLNMQWLGLQLYGYAPNEDLVLRGPAKLLAQERTELMESLNEDLNLVRGRPMPLYTPTQLMKSFPQDE
eukprot:TRINITY_DN5607_c0_g1_i1.p1 TRINITY_DN5607_c0_g1~~TRINITY_DN5607_c0_g1_i1.p1  ORF type:complete len:142 (-),score=22.37 TRINITY_DN5607_c0_g1_i1:207-632(-)